MTTPAVQTTASSTAARWGLMSLFGGLSALTLGLGGWLTSMGFGSWYDELAKPWFQPPGWVFAPVWTTIFILLTVATYQVALRPGAKAALLLYAVQLPLNVGWSLFFFARQRPDLALANIAVLDVVVLAMVVTYGRRHLSSGLMLVPYAVWLGLATAINAWIVLNN